MSKMSFEEILRSRVHRILKKVSRYQPVSDRYESQLKLEKYLLREGEEIIGAYENSDDIRKNIIITTIGILIFSGNGWKSIDYDHILRTNIQLDSNNDKRTAEKINFQLQSGAEVGILISGGDDRTRDAWSFLHFMMRVIRDYQSRKNETK